MSEKTLQGIAASSGIAIGPAFRFDPPELEIPDRDPDDDEMGRFDEARQQAAEELQAIRDRAEENMGEENAAIFDAHIMLVEDPTLEDMVQDYVDEGHIVEAAVMQATDDLAEQFAGMEDGYFAERAADMRDIGRRITRILLGLPDTSFASVAEPVIVVAEDLAPSDTARLDPDLVLGFCTALGGLTSHSAILARELGLPAVVGVGEPLDAVDDDQPLALDGERGIVFVEPEESTLADLKQREEQMAARQEMVRAAAEQTAHTADGVRIEVAANIGDANSAAEALEMGAEGVGLLRTEFLYLQESEPPSEQKQIDIYREIFEAMGDYPVIVRTMDIGGDKPPSFMDFDEEMNPFLGWRAVRISLEKPELFKTQIRAVLRAAEGHNVLIMVPFVVNLEEVRGFKRLIDEAKREMADEDIAYNDEVPVGIMVETPAAALMAEALIAELDFFSIGTNDLTQYTLAVDRTNGRVAETYQPLDPAVLRLIKMTIDASHEAGKWTGMCGEMAGMRKAIPILLGLGLDEFSMTARAIPEAKWLIGKLTTDEAQAIAEHALQLETAAEVEAYMQGILEKIEEAAL